MSVIGWGHEERRRVMLAALRQSATISKVERLKFVPLGAIYPEYTVCDFCGNKMTDYWKVGVMQACNHCFRCATDDLYEFTSGPESV